MTSPPRRELREELAHQILDALKSQMQPMPGPRDFAFSADCGTLDMGLLADAVLPIIERELAATRKTERERAANLVFELGPQLTSIGAPLWQKLGLAVRRMKDE